MEIFDWAKEIERIYEELIEKTKNENLAEIQALREEQEKTLGRSMEQKQTIVNNALKVLSEKVNKEIESFNICQASVIKAKLLVASPPNNSITKNTIVIMKAIAIFRMFSSL